MSQRPATVKRRFADVIAALLFVIFLPLIVMAIALYLLSGVFLHIAVWCCWCVRGRYVLFVYSDSPIWHGYVEERILPRLGARAVVLNWSDRKQWRRTLAVLAFRYFGGSRDFNPLAVVFRPLRLARRFRFHEPFREFKHGRPDAVVKMERELYDLVDKISGAQAA
jgi:hypothetical protein